MLLLQRESITQVLVPSERQFYTFKVELNANYMLHFTQTPDVGSC